MYIVGLGMAVEVSTMIGTRKLLAGLLTIPQL